MDHVPKAPIVTEKGILTEQARKVFANIFNNFARDGKMDDEAVAFFTQVTIHQVFVQKSDPQVKAMLANFGKENGSYLDLEGFTEFFRDATVSNKEELVRQNLFTHGYLNDLSNINEVKEPVIDITSLPRYTLSSNPRSFELLFKILDFDNSKMGEQAWDLISRLTTNEEIYNNLLHLRGEEEGGLVWDKLIRTKSKYKLLYTLQIIESFLEDEAVDKKEWRKKFISTGGFEFLLKIFMGQHPTINLSFNESIGKVEKECIGLLGEILNAFIRSAIYLLNAKLKEKVLNIGTKQLNGKLSEEESKSIQETEESNKKDQKTQEKHINLQELFKQKPSKIIFLKNTKSEKESDKKDILMLDIGKAEAEEILIKMESKEFWIRQIDILSSIVFRNEINNFDVAIVSAALNLLVSCIFISNEVFILGKNYTKGEQTFATILMKGLTCESSQSIREKFMNFLSFLCYCPEVNALEYILSILLANISKGRTSEGQNCSECYELLGKLVDIYYTSPIKSAVLEPRELLEELVEMLKKHHSAETRSDLKADKLLIGILELIRKIIMHEPTVKDHISKEDGLLQELIFKCLFPNLNKSGKEISDCTKPTSMEVAVDPQKCKTNESRTAAYKLLDTLCKENLKNQIFILKQCIEPLLDSIPPHKGWNFAPSFETRSKFGYAGIENLGCICYMNAMLQQFYMIPTFRYGILAAKDNLPPDTDNPRKIDDNMLHQLQKMFAFLELTEREYYNPTNFCYAFKDIEGNPTNIGIQQDAQEFLNLSFDRIENMLRGTPEKYLLQSVFGGKTCSQLICKGGCGNIRRNYEDFYNLSLGIRGHNTLFEALDKYIAGDTISDYNCEHCDKKVEVIKRTCLHQLPNVLVIHLQRFSFNYDTQQNEKMNSKLEFPKEFSIEPYTVEGLETREKGGSDNSKSPSKETLIHGNDPAYYEYKLAGVLVHTGTAQGGHYYSYINVNRKRAKMDTEHDLFDSLKDKWLEFNDSHIKSFDIERLGTECFGEHSEGGDDLMELKLPIFGQVNRKNAYMLVYERRIKNPIKKVIDPKEAINPIIIQEKTLECENTALSRVGQVYYDPAKSEYFTFTDFHDTLPQVPSELFREVWDDNNSFILDGQIYSREFFQFIQDIFYGIYVLLPTLVSETANEMVISMVKISTKAIYELLSCAYYNMNIGKVTDDLIALFKQYEVAAKEFLKLILQSDLKETLVLLTKCPDKSVRVAISKLLSEVLITTLTREGKNSLAYETETLDNKQIINYKTDSGKTLNLLMKAIDKELAKNWTRAEQLFLSLYNVAKDGGEFVVEFMNSQNLLTILLDFYIGKESPLNKNKEERPTMGNNTETPKFHNVINLVSLLLKDADMTFMQPNYTKLIETSSPLKQLNEDAKECLKCKELYSKVIIGGHGTKEFIKLIMILCNESLKFSRIIAKALLMAIDKQQKTEMGLYFDTLSEFFMIQDSLAKYRLEWVFGFPSPCITLEKGTAETVKFGLRRINSSVDDVNDYISALNGNKKYGPLLYLLWKDRISYEIYPLKYLLEMMVKNPIVFNYIVSMPPPNYRYAKYTDWLVFMVNYCLNDDQHNIDLGLLANVEEKININTEAIKLVVEFDKLWEVYKSQYSVVVKQPGILSAFPEPYLIGQVIKKNLLWEEKKDNITLIVNEYVTEIFQSLPNGSANKGIPETYFKKAEEVKSQANETKYLLDVDRVQKEGKEEKHPQEETKPWKVEATVLEISFKNDETKSVIVKMDFIEKSTVNFHMPISTIAPIIGGQKTTLAYLATKKSVGMEQSWGDFSINWHTKASKEIEKKENKKVSYREMMEYVRNTEDVLSMLLVHTFCPACDMINDRKSEKCLICGFPLGNDI